LRPRTSASRHHERFRVAVSYRITDHIGALGSIGVTHLLREAADSPFVERQTQPVAFMALTYTF
jgi:outer membrane protein